MQAGCTFKLNERIRTCTDAHIVIDRCLGQRYVASGARDVTIDIHGVPGNALGAYLDGAHINVYGNAQTPWRHHERRLHHHPWQQRRRDGLRHAGRQHSD